MRHVADTGQPETFPGVSTTPLPAVGDLTLLTEFSVERSRRPERDMAPCPICSPHAPQYLHGFLIWCEAAAAIYAIGGDCANKLGQAGRLDKARREYRQQRDLQRDEDYLLAVVPRIPRLRAWVNDHLVLAAAVDRVGASLRAKRPIRFALEHDTREGLRVPASEIRPDQATTWEKVGELRGRDFLADKWGLADRLQELVDGLAGLDVGDQEDATLNRVVSLTPVERRQAARFLKRAEEAIRQIHERLQAAWDFLQPSNLAEVDRWGRHPRALRRLTVRREGRVVRIDVENDFWAAKVDDIRAPDPVPGL